VSVLPIVVHGHPALHTPAAPVTEITPAISQLVSDMVDTMHEAPGVGLAAPQVGESVSIFVWSYDDGEALHEGHVINPHLVVSGWPKHLLTGRASEEGCLSIPGFRAPLARHPHAHLTGIDLDGNPVNIEAGGWLARIFQHEYDHLRGVLYSDRLRASDRQEVTAHISSRGFGNTLVSWIPGVDGEEDDFSDPDSEEYED
jgi:peptide deformylase